MNARQGMMTIASTALLFGVALGGWLAPAFMGHGEHSAQSSEPGKPAENDILYWVAPMDPGYRRDKPGKSPMGMDLVPVYADSGNGKDVLRIRPEVLNAIGAKSAPVVRKNLSLVFTAPAIVRPDADRIAHIHVRTEGWVEQLHANAEGNSVREGDLLFEIYSPALVSAQEEYLQSVKTDRLTLARAGEERLRALGMLPAQIAALRELGSAQPLYRQRAPQDGIILALNIRQGMYVQPGTTIMSLADISSVWLEAALFPSQLQQVTVGDTLDYRTVSGEPSTHPAVVDHIYPTIDDATRTAQVRAKVDNADRSLRPGQFVSADFRGPERTNVLVVPNAAIIRSRGSNRVILDLGQGRFQPAAVSTGLVTASHTEITRGLSEGDSVVISAQFLIDSEASLEPALGRMSGNDEHEHRQGGAEGSHAHEGHETQRDHEDHAIQKGHEDHATQKGHEGHEIQRGHEGHNTSPPAPAPDADGDHAHHNHGADA